MDRVAGFPLSGILLCMDIWGPLSARPGLGDGGRDRTASQPLRDLRPRMKQICLQVLDQALC